MKQHVPWTRTASFGTLAAFLGLLGFSILFGHSLTAWEPVVLFVVFFFLPGLMIGYGHPERWWIAGLIALWGVLLAAFSLTASLSTSPSPRAQNAPTLQLSIAEGTIVVSPSILKRGDLRVQQTNSGTTGHEIGIFSVGDDASLEQTLQGRFQRRDLLASLRPISPGGSEIVFYQNYFQVGRHALSR